MVFDHLIRIMGGARIEYNVQADVECVIVDWSSIFFRQSTRRKEIDARMILQILVTGIDKCLNIRC